MVVTHTVFVPGDRTARLDPPNQALLHKGAKGVIHRLAGNCPATGSDVLDELIGRRMRTMRNGLHDGDPLRGHLQAMCAELVFDGLGVNWLAIRLIAPLIHYG